MMRAPWAVLLAALTRLVPAEGLVPNALEPDKAREPYDAQTVLSRALKFWNNPQLSGDTNAALLHFARAALADAGNQAWKRQQYPALVENALRQLIAVSPDLQTS